MTTSDEHLHCVTALLEMFLVANAGIKVYQQKITHLTSGIKGVTSEISKWLKSTSVVGEYPFGSGRTSRKEKFNTELKV